MLKIGKSMFSETNRMTVLVNFVPIRTATGFFKKRGPKLGTLGAIVGAMCGTAYAIRRQPNVEDAQMKIIKPKIIEQRPDVLITKTVPTKNRKYDVDLTIFQFQTCPFCCKVRTVLDFYGIPYSVVEVDAVLRQQLKWSDYKKVPILLVKTKDGNFLQLVDSSTIISIIKSFVLDSNNRIEEIAKYYPRVTYIGQNGQTITDCLNKYFIMYQDSIKDKDEVDQVIYDCKWRRWIDDQFIPLISPNIYRTRKEALESFEWFSEAGRWNTHFPRWERNLMVYGGSHIMWLISKRLKIKYQIDDVRNDLFNALKVFLDEMKSRRTKFLGGDEPSLSDLSLFGVLCSMEGCLAFRESIDNLDIGPWFNAVKDSIEAGRG